MLTPSLVKEPLPSQMGQWVEELENMIRAVNPRNAVESMDELTGKGLCASTPGKCLRMFAAGYSCLSFDGCFLT